MGILKDHGVVSVHHYAPLHYLPFIARSRSLLCKPSLLKKGFPPKHLRSMSSAQDVARGFGLYTHLTLDRQPRILRAKLAAGFPHVRIDVPVDTVDDSEFSLCRFNVAMTRYLRRDGKPGFVESPSNGRYYDGHQVPIARTKADKNAMLEVHLKLKTMIEVLIHGDLSLTDDTAIVCFSDIDAAIAKQVLSLVGAVWSVTVEIPPGQYVRNEEYSASVATFIDRALSDSNWLGDGLEFDRV